MNENANKRTYFTPVVGEVYKNRNGWEYRCLETGWPLRDHEAIMQSTQSRWTFRAVGCGVYPDGTIEWDWSKDGFFDKPGWRPASCESNQAGSEG